jgi:hypothetical protein
MARQGLNSPGLAIRCPTPHWLVVVVAEDQDEPEEEVAEDQTDADVKRTYVTAHLHHRQSKLDPRMKAGLFYRHLNR